MKNERALIISYRHPFFDKRVFQKSLLSISELFNEVWYVVNEPPTEKLSIPENIRYLIYKIEDRSLFEKINNRKGYHNYINSIKGKFNLIYIHNIPSIIGCYDFIRILKYNNPGKIIFDLHEYIPSVYSSAFPRLFGLERCIVDKLLVDSIIRLGDGFVCVSEYVKRWLMKKGIPIERIHCVPNYAHSRRTPLSTEERERKIAFVGKLGPGNGASNVIKLADLLSNNGFIFEFIGVDRKDLFRLGFSEKLMKRANISIRGFLKYEEMLDAISTCSYTISHLNTGSTNTQYSLPNKFFDSVAAGTPIIVPENLIEQRLFISKHGGGILASLDKKSWTYDVLKIVNDKDLFAKVIGQIFSNQNSFLWGNYKNEYDNFIITIVNDK